MVLLLLVNGLATEGEGGPLHTFCLGAHLASLSSLICLSISRRVAVSSVHLQHRFASRASLDAILGVLKGAPSPTSQPGAEHVNIRSVMAEMMMRVFCPE